MCPRIVTIVGATDYVPVLAFPNSGSFGGGTASLSSGCHNFGVFPDKIHRSVCVNECLLKGAHH